MTQYDALFEPLTIKHLTIRNRFLSTSHAPGYTSHGNITDRYIRYEEEKAKGGVGLLQTGGATAVSIENSFHYGQINGSVDAVVEQYQRMSAAIHRHGGACTVQLTHGGRRERWDVGNWLPAYAPSPSRELSHGSFATQMESHDIARVCDDFATATRRARDGHIDGVEIACSSGTLIEQFWSPAMNSRDDAYGGSLENRMRFGFEVFETVRAMVGDEYIVGMRMPGDEMLRGGLSAEDCVTIARAYAQSGLIDFISVVGGQAADYESIARIWPTMWVPGGAYLPLAGAIKAVATVPVFHATRITDAATAVHAVNAGLVDMVGMTRAFIADPHHVNKLRDGRETDIRPCVGAGYCVDRVISGHDALCVQNVATSREELFCHEIEKSALPAKQVIIVGAGPGGLEAARVAASRGHQVTLLEAGSQLGGQILLAARCPWRKGLVGITNWLAEQVDRLGVKVQFHCLADANEVLRLHPDVVIVATGGVPNVGEFARHDLAHSVWDVLSGDVDTRGGSVLIFDESGDHGPLTCAQFSAAKGAQVTMLTPDRVFGTEMAETNYGAHMKELHQHGVTMRTDTRLLGLESAGNRVNATWENTYTGATSSQTFDVVVGDHGTLPNDDLYRALKPFATNCGEPDLHALVNAAAQQIERNHDGQFSLFRIGDAWASRNIHAAMLDAMRVCSSI